MVLHTIISPADIFTIFPRIWKILKKMRKYALRTLFTTLNRMSITNKIYKCGNEFPLHIRRTK